MKCECLSHNGFLTERGYAEVEQRSLEGLESRGVDTGPELQYLDKVGSVSGSPLTETHWSDALIEDQYRRFHNGS